MKIFRETSASVSHGLRAIMEQIIQGHIVVISHYGHDRAALIPIEWLPWVQEEAAKRTADKATR